MRCRKALLPGSVLLVALLCSVTGCRSFGGGPSAEPATAGTSSVVQIQSSSALPVPSAMPTIAPRTTSSAGQSIDVGYRSFANPRFGFTCDIPADFRPGEEPANGDGLAFTSPDGAAQVICSGANSGDESAEQGFADSVKAAADGGGTVTYQRLSGDAFTVTGIGSDGRIFYEHTVWGSGSNVTVYWTYPPAMKQQLDAAVLHAVQTLRPGDLSIGH